MPTPEGYIPAHLFIWTVMIGSVIILVLSAWLRKTLQDRYKVESLIVDSPVVCYTCRRFDLGHDFITSTEDDGHRLVPAYLVYIPDEDITNLWPSTPPSHRR